MCFCVSVCVRVCVRVCMSVCVCLRACLYECCHTLSSSWYFMILWTGLMRRSLICSLWPSCCLTSCRAAGQTNRHPIGQRYPARRPFTQQTHVVRNASIIFVGNRTSSGKIRYWTCDISVKIVGYDDIVVIV